MTTPDAGGSNRVPPRALVLSLATLLVPVGGSLLIPDQLGEAGALLWLLALVPAFLLAYYRGWRGAATALAAGMATLSLTQVVASLLELEIPDTLLGIVVAYIVITLAIGWLAEILLRDKATMEGMAFTDGLTQLPNRRHARVFLENEFAAAQRGRLLCVVLFDLDNFKGYNDRYGHKSGDEALEAFSEVLRKTTRRMNLSARFGGEEFLTVLAGSDAEGGVAFAERVRATLWALKLGAGPLTVSAGVAAHHPSMGTPDELLAAADHALYRAKREGRNTVRLFGETPLDTPPRAEPWVGADSTDAGEYPPAAEGLGTARPPVTLLPHQLTMFGSDRQLLLVEAEDPIRALIATYLNREGFEVTEVTDLSSALGHLGTEFDVVITCKALPEGDGAGLVTSVKSRWPATQVLVLATSDDITTTAEMLASGADRHLVKPFGMPELRTQLVDCLARRDRLVAMRTGEPLTDEGRKREELARARVVEGVVSLVRAAETRDPHTVGHGERVAAFALEIAAVLDPEGKVFDAEALRLGGLAHDIGKIGIDDGILNKPGALDEKEWAAMRTHPKAGRQLLAALVLNATVEAAITWHHEHWDGTGYPDGLSGDAIPLAARVVALADALAAMIEPRSFREAMSWEEAVETVRAEFGTTFDPALKPVFEAALPKLKSLQRDTETAED